MPAIGCQWFAWKPEHDSSYAKDIAPCRTFCVYEEVGLIIVVYLFMGFRISNLCFLYLNLCVLCVAFGRWRKCVKQGSLKEVLWTMQSFVGKETCMFKTLDIGRKIYIFN